MCTTSGGRPRLGVLQRFERRLEGMVEGAFARAFRSELQPVEVASAVQREMDDRAAIVAKGRTLVPNDFVVELAENDHERLDVYAESLGVELANLARDYAKEQGYSFVGPVRMRFDGVPDMTTGTFRIRSGVIRGSTIEGGEIRMPASDLPRTTGRGFPGHPRLLVSGPGDRKSTRLNSSHLVISYAVFCLKKKQQLHIIISQNRSWNVMADFILRHTRPSRSVIDCVTFVL